MPARRFVVTGHVQGVGYRFFVAREACVKGLKGFVRNQSDGSVEVVASGPDEDLEWLRDRLAEGPPLSRVDNVGESRYDGVSQLETFEIRQI